MTGVGERELTVLGLLSTSTRREKNGARAQDFEECHGHDGGTSVSMSRLHPPATALIGFVSVASRISLDRAAG
jgi:hypothetical protein